MASKGDETNHVILLGKIENNKKYKEQILKEIIAAMCAMLNTNGGKAIIRFETDPNIPVEGSPSSHVSVIQILEQSMKAIIGLNQTVSKIEFTENIESIIIVLKKSDSLITTNYNLYLPSQKLVAQVDPWEPPENVMNDIINRKIVKEQVRRDSHCKQFLKGKNCGLYESKISQLKYLKAEQSKRTRIGDRVTGKGNKFSCYVSAFANHRGGHVYFGINNEGVVEGEKISNDDISDIKKKVEKAINKMIWPKMIGQPKRGEHWEIFFEPMLDKDSKPIPSTFVIVIYIAPCLGGVFTEEPECYEMMKGKVQKMSFARWRTITIPLPTWLLCKEEIPSSLERITWSSSDARKAFTVDGDKLRQLISHAKWDEFFYECQVLENSTESFEVKLLVLAQKVRAHYRRGEFEKAGEHLEHYLKMMMNGQDRSFFEMIGLYLQAALCRARKDYETLKETLIEALYKAEYIEPGLVTATVYVFAATVTDLIEEEDPSRKLKPDILSRKALEHLDIVPDRSEVVEDMKLRVLMTLATFYLGCNISGKRIQDNIDTPSLDKAMDCIKRVHSSIVEGHVLTTYYDALYNLVLSVYKYRQSQVQCDQRSRYLENSLQYAKKAEKLARDSRFGEMVEWCMTHVSFCEQEKRTGAGKTKCG